MDWGQVITIIFGTAGFMGIFVLLINRQIDMVNKRIDDLKHDMDNRFNDVNKRLDKIEEDIRDFKREVNERLNRMEDLLHRVLGVETKKQV